ncbi:hypothetical protein H5407_13635 [Mitsuaria sp. WAJ17]|uniref:hypothetical protein n=1 Tax=Mitsuaria sp. WAJ17 TaxID=2761452 RepID=UPI0016015A87|nr:hypothetical protein [Mitsuaria sp. WAJ17]MBB2486259.1 hypothetical protein [Mitsuaria sp. WAJ17]
MNMALRGDWSWKTVMISAVSAGVGSAVAGSGTDFGSVLTRGLAAGVTATALSGGNRRAYESVFMSSLGSALGESLAYGSPQKPAPTFAQDKAARERANDPAGLRDFANYRSSNGFQTTRSYSAVDLYGADDMKFDRMLLGDRMAALAAPQAFASSAALPATYLAVDGTGHWTPQAPVVVNSRALSADASGGLDYAGVYDEYGLFTMPGSAPIWNGVVSPVAREVGAAATFPQHFKSAVLTELEDQGRDAALKGDDRALMVLGMKHTYVNMLLPGSPQEAAFGVGAGAAIGKVAPWAVGYLNRLPVLGDTLPQLGNRISGMWAQGMENLAVPRTLNPQFGGVLVDDAGKAFTPAPKSGLGFELSVRQHTDALTTVDLITKERFSPSGEISNRPYPTSFIYTTFNEETGHLFIDKMAAQPGRHIGREMISNIIEAIGPDNVKSIGAEFAETNLAVFRDSLSSGFSEFGAAQSTPLGKALRDLGFENHLTSVKDAYPRPAVFYRIKGQ